MKISLIFVLLSLGALNGSAKLESKQEGFGDNGTGRPSTKWYRDSKLILVQTDSTTDNISLGTIRIPETTKRGFALIITIMDKRISGISGGSGLNDYQFSIDDYTEDGVPDFIQIKVVDEDGQKVVEAFSLVDGVLEPIPDHLFLKERRAFYYEDEIVQYLKKKQNKPEMATPRKSPD